MECLKNYIGVLGCGWVPPVPEEDELLEDVFSELYVNQLPGISLKSIDKIADQEQVNFLGVWKDVEKRALLKFGTVIRGRLSLKHSLTENTIVSCLVCTNKKFFSVALWYLMGAELMIERTSSDRLNRYTIGNDLEKAEKLKAEFYAEYQAAFDDGFNSIDITGSDCLNNDCLECNDVIGFVESLP